MPAEDDSKHVAALNATCAVRQHEHEGINNGLTGPVPLSLYLLTDLSTYMGSMSMLCAGDLASK